MARHIDDKPAQTLEDVVKASEREQSEQKEPTQSPLDLAKIEGMDANALKTLIQKVYKAGWGYGGLTGKDLLEMALKTKDEAYEALKLRAIVLATNATEWREFVALATFWAEREKGKPQQSVDISGKIGIVDIVLEAGRRRQLDQKPVIIENAEN